MKKLNTFTEIKEFGKTQYYLKEYPNGDIRFTNLNTQVNVNDLIEKLKINK